MKYKPHNYQTHATNFIQQHHQAAILLGMGMGKTIITLTAINNLLERKETQRVLIIAPIRVARDTWPQEIKKWDHLKHLRMSIMVGTPQQRLQALNADADIWTINRENIPWLVQQLKGKWPFDMVVIDELSSFKNHQAKRFKALRTIRPKINRIIGLTGTPAPNSLIDLWAPFRLLDQGQRLGKNITLYRTKYFEPDKRNAHQIFTWKLKPEADEDIYKAISDITVSMKTSDYLNLPDVTHSHITVHMSTRQRKQYQELKKEMVLELGDDMIDATNAASLSGKLQQLASGAIYTNGEGDYTIVHDEKIEALKELVEQAEGNTILVAYWFQHERDRILSEIPNAQVLDTEQDFLDWNAGRIPVALIHPASAGHGLNLQTGGHILVWMTTPWSLELYEQTNARLHRQGQAQPVSIVHINTADTIDTQVHEALERKNIGQQALIDAVKAELEGVTK